MEKPKNLKKNLGLFDVFAISTGAMFSSGFFLLPGLATAEAGPATVLAYLLAGLLMLPTLFSMAELSTAMPKAGGSYYFMDRSLGPLLGTIGGFGTWLALVFKSSFALIGLGAYLVIFIDLPVKPVAIGLTVAFTLLNIFGVKETSLVQRILVTALVAILTVFIIAGLLQVEQIGFSEVKTNQLTPFFPFGFDSTIFTVGLVFVSYAGLTKIASVSEEVQNPEKNIPRGMLLSLAAATFLYVTGVFILVALLPPAELREDLTPVATASSEVFQWMPGQIGLILIVVAAIASFTSTANAGIMSASRYPLAMARDNLIKSKFAKIGRFGTPHFSIIATGIFMILIILIFSELGMAKLASAFQLLIFAILNVAVIIMRESNIPSYLPGYKSPFYPWMQILGIIFSLFLISNMGLLSIFFSLGIILMSILWFYVYARKKVIREGAIYHIFERLGRERHKELEDEFRVILKEKGPIDPVAYEDMIARSKVFIEDESETFEDALEKAVSKLEKVLPLDHDEIKNYVKGEKNIENIPVFNHIAIPHFSDPRIEKPEIIIMRFVDKTIINRPNDEPRETKLEGLILLSGNESNKNMHLRFLSQLANLIDQEDFLEKWCAAKDKTDLKECFLEEEKHLVFELKKNEPTEEFIDKKVKYTSMDGCRILYIYRGENLLLAENNLKLEEGDRITVIGEKDNIKQLKERIK
ncbi:MAG: amino acid permease [Candidatus Cyclobacteriaceae bacterium M2_1C_046]